MIDRQHPLPLRRQAVALGISRGSVYYLPRPVPAADLAVMLSIDKLHLEYPFAGSRMMRDLLLAIIPHRSWVNLQLADGVDLPDPDGRIEGTGKRIRHLKVRSVEDARAPWVRATIAAQVVHRRA